MTTKEMLTDKTNKMTRNNEQVPVVLTQYPMILHPPQILLSTGVTSLSMLVHVSGGAKVDACFSNTQACRDVNLLLAVAALPFAHCLVESVLT